MKEHLLEKLTTYKELALCAKDPVYFIDNYATCINPTHGNFPMVLQEYQEDLLKTYVNSNTIVNAPRQSGITLTTSMYILWYAMFNPFKTIGIISDKRQSTFYNLVMVRHAYNNLPDFLKEIVGIKVNNKGSMQFSNDSLILALSTEPCSMRGISFDMIHLDNFSYVKESKQEDIYDYVQISTYANKSKIIITSTGANAVGKFHELFQDALVGMNSFKSVHIKIDSLSPQYKRLIVKEDDYGTQIK